MKAIHSLLSSVRRRPWQWGVLLAVGLIYLLPILSVPGLSAVFMKLGDIKGEATDAEHKDWIDVESFSWGVSRTISAAGQGGRDVSPPKPSEVGLAKRIDKSTPILMLQAAAGEVIPEVTLHFTRADAGGRQQTYYTVTLNDVLVSSYASSSGGSGDAVPVDSISLNFTKMQMSYVPQNADGSSGTPVEGGYDFESNKPQ